MKKYVYTFGGGDAQGNASQRNLLGGKGANLAEMAKIGLPVPAGFTISTECCVDYFKGGSQFPASLRAEVEEAMAATEKIMALGYGNASNPLLISARSGARHSMPGMMETVLNVGLTSKTIPGMIAKTGNERFVYDAYRRLIMMYSDVVMEKAEGIEPAEDMGIRMQLDRLMHQRKHDLGYSNDTDFTAAELKQLCEQFKERIVEVLGVAFPDDAEQQLWGAIGAVFKSWNGRRAVAYRRIENIPDEWGTTVTVQSMVFGNMGESSATGVAFTRNPATGENKFYGEWLVNAQGEDVVAGSRTPNPLNEDMKTEQNGETPSLQTEMPAAYQQLVEIRAKLEQHYHDMQDIEFTIQEGTLYMLQCRSGKRTGTAALNMAMDMLSEGLVDERTAVTRVEPVQLDELLHPLVDPAAEKTTAPIAKGLPAGPGGAVGQIVFTSRAAVAAVEAGKTVILVREETNPEDVEGMRAAEGILTARGGMTSHAALVARGWGKCCIVGAGMLNINAAAKTMCVNGKTYNEGDVISLNGTKGLVYGKQMQMIKATENPRFQTFMGMADKFRSLGVRANADTAEDARRAREFGAEGIGLFRTEHMFYGIGSDEPLFLLRKMIISSNSVERQKALNELFSFVKRDIKSTLEAMDSLPVTVRLLDPPLHEFVPKDADKQAELAAALNISVAEVVARGEALHESNPMMGHRGVRLGITYPEVTQMQVRAVLEAAAELLAEGKDPRPEIMIPVTCDANELKVCRVMVDSISNDVNAKFNREVPFQYGTMIEIPRAALLADELAEQVQFFSFGTNDLTQMTYGFSRDDIGGFMPAYLNHKILTADPFQTIDQHGVGQLIKYAVQRGRATCANLKIGICGEQGGDPASVEFCFKTGLNYVSCSPYRVPIARLAAAHAAIKASK